MNLDRSMIGISLTDRNRGFFKILDSIRPNHISFSQFLGVSANEYYANHKEGVSKITDFTNKDVVAGPMYYTEFDFWKKYIESMPRSEVKKFQKRHAQLGNLINKKVQEIIN